MKYRNSIIVLGFLVVVIHFLGFPQGMREALAIVAGFAVVALGYLAGRR